MRGSEKTRTGPAARRGRWLWWLAPAVAVLAWAAWSWLGRPAAAPAEAHAATPAGWGTASPFGMTASGVVGPASAAFRATSSDARSVQLAMWQQRLDRAQTALAAYRATTRYPHESRPASEQPDQVHPNAPVVDDQPLRMAGGKPVDGVRLKTMQERVFVQGSEVVHFSVALQDASGQLQPLRISRASAREIPTARTATNLAFVSMDFNDDGRGGDDQPGDNVYGAQLQPSAQGFNGGQIRVELILDYRGQQGSTSFDLFYTPQSPAEWQGGVREAMENGSLSFFLKADVREPGRYVVTGRLDDAEGKPFALLTFNDELGAGVQQVRLSLFGKLVRDARPAFPLTLRDVDGFLLRPDSFPDRSLMPRLAGRVHTSSSYPLSSFSDQEWSSEERDRYLAELTRDVDQAQQQVNQLGGGR